MSNYAYIAVDPHGTETQGILDVATQGEALQRIKEMGLFPTKIHENPRAGRKQVKVRKTAQARTASRFHFPRRKIKPRTLAVFTRQLATLLEAGLPLLRGLRLLREQEEDRRLRRVIEELSLSIENGLSFAEALELQSAVFSRLYVNMVKAGEIGGALEIALRRLAEFMEKSQRIKSKVKSAMVYPCAVLFVAFGIVTLLMTYVLPKFKLVFEGLADGRPLPAFTRFVMGISDFMKTHLGLAGLILGIIGVCLVLVRKTNWGRGSLDYRKLVMPVVGPVFRKAAISRFTRTLGTLVSSGVPILQALTIVKETAGNQTVGDVISTVHDRVKEGDPIAPTLRISKVFPSIVAGMVEVGEQTGALPEMLNKIADNYDDEVDNAVSSMTALLEPLMIIFLAVIVGSIVIAMFLPIIGLLDPHDMTSRVPGE
jgi:type IV pilus assembly protein PilC